MPPWSRNKMAGEHIAPDCTPPRLSHHSGWLQTLFQWHNMWKIAMFYQGVKRVRRKLCTSCTSPLSWQNACINSDLVNTIKTSVAIKHFYEVTGQINKLFFPLFPPHNRLWKVCLFFPQLLRGDRKKYQWASSNRKIIGRFANTLYYTLCNKDQLIATQ